jgi:Icc-related predicted phosphoesterase
MMNFYPIGGWKKQMKNTKGIGIMTIDDINKFMDVEPRWMRETEIKAYLASILDHPNEYMKETILQNIKKIISDDKNTLENDCG